MILCRSISTIISGKIKMNLELLKIILWRGRIIISKIIYLTMMIIFQRIYLLTKLLKLVNSLISKIVKTRKFKLRRKILKMMILIFNIRDSVKSFIIALIAKMNYKMKKSFSIRIGNMKMLNPDLV